MRTVEVKLFNSIKHRQERSYTWHIPECTPEEQFKVDNCKLPIDKKAIIDVLSRYVAMHKRHEHLSHEHKAILYADIADFLFGHPEYAVVLGATDLITKDKSPFFPSTATILDSVASHVVHWPTNLEAGYEAIY